MYTMLSFFFKIEIILFIRKKKGSHTQNAYQTTPKELQSHVQKLRNQ